MELTDTLFIHLMVLIFGSIACCFVLLIDQFREDKRRAAERAERRRIQDLEWQQQLRQNPWLQRIIEEADQPVVEVQVQRTAETMADLRIISRAGRAYLAVDGGPLDLIDTAINWKEEGF